jgi:hypothetical protein
MIRYDLLTRIRQTLATGTSMTHTPASTDLFGSLAS